MAQATAIETGVDKLVKLVAREKKMTVDDAAKELSVSPTVVQEWADFLEEEGLIETQYSLSKTFLVEKRLNKTEIEKKSKEYENKKEGFIRKVDATLKQLENETADFETINKQYYALKDQIGDEIDVVKEEVEQLRHYQDLKKSIDEDILKQKVEYQKSIDEIHGSISAEEKRYGRILQEINDESLKLNTERNEFGDLKKEEGDLLKRIDALQDIIKSIIGRLSTQEQSMDQHEERLQRLRELGQKLQEELVEKKEKEIAPLVKVSNDQAQRIQRIQDEILAKIKERRDKMQSFQTQSEEVSSRFARFFEKQARTEALLKELEESKTRMRDELTDLIRKAKAFDIASKGSDTNAHIKELEGKFKEFDSKKNAFAQKLEDLKSVILGKGSPKVLDTTPMAKQAAQKATKSASPGKPARDASAKPTKHDKRTKQ